MRRIVIYGSNGEVIEEYNTDNGWVLGINFVSQTERIKGIVGQAFVIHGIKTNIVPQKPIPTADGGAFEI